MTPELRPILAGLLAALLAASLTGYWLSRKQNTPAPWIENLNSRIRAWWIMIFIGVAVLLAGRQAIIGLFAVLSFLALREYIPAGHIAGLLVSVLALAAQYTLLALDRQAAFISLIPGGCLIGCCVLGRFKHVGTILLANMICVYGVSHVPALLMLEIPGDSSRNTLLAFFLVLVVQTSDVLQYVTGRLVGRHKLAPRISPAKTIEGTLGGIAGATALGAALATITPFTRLEAAAISLLITTAGVVGGLGLSAMKRRRGIKDWGNTIAGHGGVLDRLDSLCLSAPLLFHITRYFFGSRP